MDPQSFASNAPNSFARDACISARIWLPSALASAAACWWLAAHGYSTTMLEWVAWLPIGLLLLPLAFTLALACCVVVLAVVLGALAIPAWVGGRPTGLAGVLADSWRLAAGIIPGFWRALRRVRRPGLWGAALGVFVGTVAEVAVGGFA